MSRYLRDDLLVHVGRDGHAADDDAGDDRTSPGEGHKARLHDPTLDTFSRQEAAELIPKSNPFLRKLFGYIAGPDIDDRIKWVVENLAEIFT